MSLYTYQASVLRVVDGDTIEVSIDLGFHLWMRTTMRLAKINAPELSTPEGQASKAFLVQHLPIDTRGVLTSHRLDKYGRVLGDFMPDHSQHSIAQIMALTGHAVVVAE